MTLLTEKLKNDAQKDQANHLLEKSKNTGISSVYDLINKSTNELKKALPNQMNPERLTRIALTCIRNNPVLGKCSPASFLGALFTAAQVGLEPVAGKSYLIPFLNRKLIDEKWTSVYEVQFVIGYQGLKELFFRHNKSICLSWGVVYENDSFDFEYGSNSFLSHKPTSGEKGEIKGYWVMAELQGGGRPFKYMTNKECMEHGRKHSKTFDSKINDFKKTSPWKTNPESMCLKTVLIQLSKLLPSSIESIITLDESSRSYTPTKFNSDDIIDLPPSETDWGNENEQ